MKNRQSLLAVAIAVSSMAGYGGKVTQPQSYTGGGESRYYQLVDSADLALKSGNWSDGERLIRQALRESPANPGNTMLFSNLGFAQMQQERYPEALESFDLALVRAPGSSTIRAHRARTNLALGRRAEALEDLDILLATDSLSEWGLQTRGMLKLTSEKERTAKGKALPERSQTDLWNPEAKSYAEDFARLRRHYPQNSWGWYGGGCISEQQGDSGEAERYWLQCLEIEKEKSADEKEAESETSFRLAMLYLGEGETGKAQSLLRSYLGRYPKDGKLLAAMGWYHRQMLLREESDADLRLALEYGAPRELVEWISRQGSGKMKKNY